MLPLLAPYYVSRAALGLFILSGALVGLYNVVMTLIGGREPALDEVQVEEAA